MFQKVNNELWELKEGVLTVIYPRRCPICDDIVEAVAFKDGQIRIGSLVHEGCRPKVRYVSGATCMKCGKPLSKADNDREYCIDCERVRHVFDRGFSVFDYRSISGSVYKFKYMGRQEYAAFYGQATRRLLGSLELMP